MTPRDPTRPAREPATPRQLALPIESEPLYLPEDFLAADSNAEARAWLLGNTSWPSHRLILFGEAGCGKTHLLHLWAARTGATIIPARALIGLPPAPTGPVAIDDADQPDDETSLLHLLNAAEEGGQKVVMAARTPPSMWDVRLPDLASRLRAAPAIGIRPPDDDLLRALLARLLSDRQLAVPEPIQDFLLLRLPRTPAALRDAASRLDHLALAAGRRVTRGMAAEVLAAYDTAG
jgi:chromosomal replication initiation ATPase DnaA